MSDYFIVLVPRDPTWVAAPQVQERVTAILRSLAPSADSVTPEVSEAIRFHDAGSNFEGIRCPRCAAKISIDWWQDRMDEDANGDGFSLATFSVPCCGALLNLNDLEYEANQAFARTSWTIQNANIGKLSDEASRALESAAGISLVVVYQHL
jgi:hypothetical protein